MRTEEEVQAKLDALIKERAALYAQHQNLTAARESLGAKINAADGAIVALRGVLSETPA